MKTAQHPIELFERRGLHDPFAGRKKIHPSQLQMVNPCFLKPRFNAAISFACFWSRRSSSPPGEFKPFGVICDADVLIAPLQCLSRHVLDGPFSIALLSVHLEVSLKVLLPVGVLCQDLSCLSEREELQTFWRRLDPLHPTDLNTSRPFGPSRASNGLAKGPSVGASL